MFCFEMNCFVLFKEADELNDCAPTDDLLAKQANLEAEARMALAQVGNHGLMIMAIVLRGCGKIYWLLSFQFILK